MLVLEITDIIPFILSSTEINALGPPISVLTHPGWSDITDIPKGEYIVIEIFPPINVTRDKKEQIIKEPSATMQVYVDEHNIMGKKSKQEITLKYNRLYVPKKQHHLY